MYKDSDGRICGSQWGIFAQVILPLPIINCAAQCVLCSHFGIDWNVHEFFAPETLLFSCSNLFSVIDIHSTGSWSKWLLVLGNLRASTLQVKKVVSVFSFGRSKSQIATDWKRQPQTATDCSRLPNTAVACHRLLQTATDYNRLPQTAKDCQRLS